MFLPFRRVVPPSSRLPEVRRLSCIRTPSPRLLAQRAQALFATCCPLAGEFGIPLVCIACADLHDSPLLARFASWVPATFRGPFGCGIVGKTRGYRISYLDMFARSFPWRAKARALALACWFLWVFVLGALPILLYATQRS